jgi:hypothetical protein
LVEVDEQLGGCYAHEVEEASEEIGADHVRGRLLVRLALHGLGATI